MHILTAVFNSKPMKKDFAGCIVDTVRRTISNLPHNLLYIIRHDKSKNELVHCHCIITFDDYTQMKAMEDFLSSYQTRFYFIKVQECVAINAYFRYIHHELTQKQIELWAENTEFDRKIIFYNKKLLDFFYTLKNKYLSNILGLKQSEGLPRSGSGGTTNENESLFLEDM